MSTIVPPLLSASLGFNVHRTALLVRRELVRALAGLGLTPEQWHVLAVLDHVRTAIPQKALVQELLRDKPTVTRVLQRMERNGWIKREPSEADARVTLVCLTPAGKSLVRKAPGRITAHFDKKLDCLSSAQEQRMINDLKALQGALEATSRRAGSQRR